MIASLGGGNKNENTDLITNPLLSLEIMANPDMVNPYKVFEPSATT